MSDAETRETVGLLDGTFLSLFVATGAAMLGFGIVEPIMPLYAKHMGASGVVLGLVFAGFALSRGLFAPIMGQLSDRYGRKRILLAGLAGYVVLSIAYTFAGSPLVLTVLRFGQGFTSVMVTPIAQSYVGDVTPEGKEGEFMNVFYISLFGGMALGPSVGGYLTDAVSFQAPFYAMAVVAAFALVLVYVAVPRSPATDDDGGRDVPGVRESLRAVYDDLQMRGVLTYIAARGFYRWGFNSFFPVFAVSVAALSTTQVGFVLSGYMAVGGVLQYPMGRLADSYSEYRIAFIGAGGLIAALAMFVIPTLHSLVPLLGLVLGMGSASSLSRASTVAIRTERGRVHGMGAVTGAFTSSLSVGQVVGPLAFGAVVDAAGLRQAFYLGGVVGILGTLGALWYLHRGKLVLETAGDARGESS